LNLTGKGRGKLQAWQAYASLYYEDEGKNLKQKIEGEYANYIKQVPDHGETPEALFTFRNRRLRELYEAETDDIKTKVEVECAKNHVTATDQKELDKLLVGGVKEDVDMPLRKK